MKSLRILLLIVFFGTCDINVYSHKSYSISSDGNKPEADITSKTRTIKIIDHDDKSHKLKLRDESNADAEEIIVDSDDEIIWDNQDNSIDIVRIENKFLAWNHFKNKPDKLSPGHWKGRVKSYSDTVVRKAKYFIRWKHKDAPKKYTYDPLIKINPSHSIKTP